VFASRVKGVVKVGDVTVNIRKLSARSLEKAPAARQAAVGMTMKGFGTEVLQFIREGVAERTDKTESQEEKEPYGTYDREATLIAGIESWDAMRPNEKTGDQEPIPLLDGIADLDEAAAEKIFRAIVDLSIPSQEENEEAQGKS